MVVKIFNRYGKLIDTDVKNFKVFGAVTKYLLTEIPIYNTGFLRIQWKHNTYCCYIIAGKLVLNPSVNQYSCFKIINQA